MKTIMKSRNGSHEKDLSTIENAKERGSAYWEMAKAKGKKLWKGTVPTRRQAWGKTKSFIKKHPVQAVGYVVLMGILFTIFLRFKDQE